MQNTYKAKQKNVNKKISIRKNTHQKILTREKVEHEFVGNNALRGFWIKLPSKREREIHYMIPTVAGKDSSPSREARFLM